jgi:hypothetical protein
MHRTRRPGDATGFGGEHIDFRPLGEAGVKRGDPKKSGLSTPSQRGPASPRAGLSAPATDTIVVLTADRADDILARGGSGDWVLNVEKASRHHYLVCCRKARWDNRSDAIPDSAAFLIGVIKGFVKAEQPTNARAQYRYRIELSEVARINQPNVWNRAWRNPVGYVSLAELGLDPQKLKMKPITAAGKPPAPVPPAPRHLTIAEAKKALAASFGVEPEDVEIHIRG